MEEIIKHFEECCKAHKPIEHEEYFDMAIRILKSMRALKLINDLFEYDQDLWADTMAEFYTIVLKYHPEIKAK